MSDVPRCGALGCSRAIGPAMVFCTEHWRLLPNRLRDSIYASIKKPDKYVGAKAAAVSWLNNLRGVKP